METKPILFNTDMVCAILYGRKTVARRIVKPQPRSIYHDGKLYEEDGNYFVLAEDQKGNMGLVVSQYRPGDILYVRETFLQYDRDHIIGSMKYAYKADATPESEMVRKEYGYKWRLSIHMPKEAARIFLWVTDVRVERLQNITAEHVLNEGVDVKFPEPKPGYISLAYTEMRLKPEARKQFADLWDKTIKLADLSTYGWEANPWVWVIAFEWKARERDECCEF